MLTGNDLLLYTYTLWHPESLNLICDFHILKVFLKSSENQWFSDDLGGNRSYSVWPSKCWWPSMQAFMFKSNKDQGTILALFTKLVLLKH